MVNAREPLSSGGIGPASELLLSCARKTIGAGGSERIRVLLQQPLDWTQVLSLALEHRVAPLLYWHVRAACPELLPKQAAEFLQAYFQRNEQRNNFLTGELCRLIDLLRANGIPAIPFRGPVFAAALYGHLGLRYFDDLDLMVHRQDVLKALDCLASEGFQPHFAYSRAQAAAFARAGNEFQLLRGRDRVNLGLHWRIAPRSFSVSHDAQLLWEGLQAVRLDGREWQTVAPENLLLISCIEGTRNLWRRLGSIGDLAELIETNKGLDWDALLATAGRVGCRRLLFVGLVLAKDLLEAAVPQEVLARAKQDPVVEALATKAKSWLFADSASSAGELAILQFQLEAREHWRDRVLSATRRALTPGLGDWRFASLPNSLAFLYYPLRPLRVGLRVVRHVLTRTRLDLAPYLPTPMEVVERMLAMAELSPRDVLYDIGCGDGRIVILAAKKYGARGLGVDIDPQRVAEAKKSARDAGVEHLVSFIQQDAKTLDLSGATVATMYLLPTSNLKFRLKLEQELPPGARILAHRFDMAEWTPTKTDVVTLPNGESHTLYLWRIEKPEQCTPAGL